MLQLCHHSVCVSFLLYFHYNNVVFCYFGGYWKLQMSSLKGLEKSLNVVFEVEWELCLRCVGWMDMQAASVFNCRRVQRLRDTTSLEGFSRPGDTVLWYCCVAPRHATLFTARQVLQWRSFSSYMPLPVHFQFCCIVCLARGFKC